MGKIIAIAAVLLVVLLLLLLVFRKPSGKTQKAAPRAIAKGKSNEADPLAEADVYLAYGREKQAMEILEQASRKYPDRQDIADRLAELKQKTKR